MFITAETNISINNTPEAIWDYASDPSNWTASNPHKHIDFTCNSAYSRPAMDVEFLQQESVAGVYADLRGSFRAAVLIGSAFPALVTAIILILIFHRPSPDQSPKAQEHAKEVKKILKMNAESAGRTT
jgi:hypothetical protein